MKSTIATNSFNVDKSKVEVYGDCLTMGTQVTRMVGERLRRLLSRQEEIRMILAAAPSQDETLEELASSRDIDWTRVAAFHMDEYVGLQKGAEKSFGTFLSGRIFSRVKFGKVHYINSMPGSLNDRCEGYSRRLGEAPIDIVGARMGENGHIAFNDAVRVALNDEISIAYPAAILRRHADAVLFLHADPAVRIQ